MYDPLTGRYAFACPIRGETHVLLSAFPEPRLAPARRRSVLQRPRDRGGGTHVRRGRPRDARRVPAGAVVVLVRRAQACTRVIGGTRIPRWDSVVPLATGNGTR